MINTRFGSRLFLLSLACVLLMLGACASLEPGGSTDDQATSPAVSPGQGQAMFPAWLTAGRSVDNRNEQIAVPAVIIRLASQVDAQIAKSEWQAANDTLERLLRIEPEYAPGWSRMAWLALRAGDAERSRQMAARSNSYAAGRIDLKLLNWGFIRDASEQLNDRANVQRAERNIEALGNM